MLPFSFADDFQDSRIRIVAYVAMPVYLRPPRFTRRCSTRSKAKSRIPLMSTLMVNVNAGRVAYERATTICRRIKYENDDNGMLHEDPYGWSSIELQHPSYIKSKHRQSSTTDTRISTHHECRCRDRWLRSYRNLSGNDENDSVTTLHDFTSCPFCCLHLFRYRVNTSHLQERKAPSSLTGTTQSQQ